LTFSTFVLKEGLKNSQILTLHKFNELYRDQVMLDLRENLSKAWKAVLKTAKASLNKAEAEEALLRNDKAVTQAVLNLTPVKSHYGSKPVSPSVSIPLILPEERRNLLEKALLNAAEAELSSLITTWSEAFMFERPSGMKTHFKIKRDTTSVRLVLAGTTEGITHEAVICFVGIEHGKANTKTKAFDLVCLATPS
jgi:uncharacterized protein YbcI